MNASTPVAGGSRCYDSQQRAAVVAFHDDAPPMSPRDLRSRISALLELGPSSLVLDLSRQRRLTSDAIDVLLWLDRRCAPRSVRVVLREPSRSSIDLLRRTGLLGRMTIEATGARP